MLLHSAPSVTQEGFRPLAKRRRQGAHYGQTPIGTPRNGTVLAELSAWRLCDRFTLMRGTDVPALSPGDTRSAKAEGGIGDQG